MSAQHSIHFFKEGVSFRLSKTEETRKWIKSVFRKYDKGIGDLNYIFCSDRYLRKMNKEYLQHDYNTDIITFDNSILTDEVKGDIFISVDRVKANAKKFGTAFKDELHRVMIHGALHLCGFNDKNAGQREKMRKAEDLWLSKRKF